MSALNATLSTQGSKKFLILLARLINSTSVLVINLNLTPNINNSTKIKKTLFSVFFYICVLFLSTSLFALGSPTPLEASQATENHCSTISYDETTYIKHIHDGDTLTLRDGRKVRLIGINTPELARNDKPAERYSAAAKNTLKSLFKNEKSISLVYGKDNKDSYGRTLAHAFLANGQNVQATLLKQGFANTITLPPNTRFSACYAEMENNARCNNRGIWQHSNILDAKKLNKQHNGFHLIKGRVKDIDINNKGIWLNLDDKLTVGIRSDNRSLFNRNTINDWKNQSITVRGWLNKNHNRKLSSNPFYIRVRHPASIQLSSDLGACRA